MDSDTLDVSHETLSHLPDGRPFYKAGFDVSVSHKRGRRLAIAVRSPYRIGIDIEDLCEEIHTGLFARHVCTPGEQEVFRAYVTGNNLTDREGLVAFWSMKEAFCKAASLPLVMSKIHIAQVVDEHVSFAFATDIGERLLVGGLSCTEAIWRREGKLFFTQVILKQGSGKGE